MRNLLISLLVFGLCLAAACTAGQSGHSDDVATTPLVVNNASRNESSKLPEVPDEPIASIDFRNFTFPWPASLRSKRIRYRTLALHDGSLPEVKGGAGPSSPPGDGGAQLLGEAYGDVTGDGAAEAIAVVHVPVGPHGWGVNCVYVYTLDDTKPRLLTSFADGDRANAGFKDVYASDGDLVVELWGRESVLVAGDAIQRSNDMTAACCPEVYTKGVYKWSGSVFKLNSTEVIPNPEPGSIQSGPTHFRN